VEDPSELNDLKGSRKRLLGHHTKAARPFSAKPIVRKAVTEVKRQNILVKEVVNVGADLNHLSRTFTVANSRTKNIAQSKE
jgi:hypothetical protein